MDTSVNLKPSTEKLSIWNAIKSFFADSVDENEIDEDKIKEIESKQDTKYIENLENMYLQQKLKKVNQNLKII